MEVKLGKTIYSITFYEKVKCAVMPIGKNGDFILTVSFDNNTLQVWCEYEQAAITVVVVGASLRLR